MYCQKIICRQSDQERSAESFNGQKLSADQAEFPPKLKSCEREAVNNHLDILTI